LNKTTVIYHSADFDGIFCREIARKFLPEAKLIGWNFEDALIPYPDKGQVYVLDLSPDCFVSSSGMSLPDYAEAGVPVRMIWIDHHKSSIEKCSSTIPGYRIDGVAACRLAWQWFQCCDGNWPAPRSSAMASAGVLPMKQDFINRTVNEPLAVRLAGEYDIWDKRDPNAELFQHGLRSQELTADVWERLLCDGIVPAESDMTVLELLSQGECLQYAKTSENESIIKAAGFDLDFEGLHFLACNHARYNSFLFTAGLKPEHDACLGFAWRGGKWTVSMYHAPGKEHIDLSAIAVKHGGGGHRGACGFVCAELPFKLNHQQLPD